jgi:flagellar protein FlbD
MIRLTRLNGTRFIVNAVLIERIEATPDTILRLTTGTQYVVKETPDEVTELAVRFLSSIRGGDPGGHSAGQLGRATR